jgi:hypothetical protein
MNWKKSALVIGGVSLLAALWLCWWVQPERQIPRAQARLLSAIEKRDFAAMGAMLAGEYSDRWKQDRAAVLERSREVFGQFAMLTVEHGSRGLRAESGRWMLDEKVRIKGLGSPIATLARDTVNALHEPFVMEWRRRSWKPWDWELVSVTQPELELP